MSLWIRLAGLGRECNVIDDVAAVAGQFQLTLLLGWRRAGFRELAGNAAELHNRRAGRKGHHNRHLQENPEEVSDIVGRMFIKAFCTVAALQKEGATGRNFSKLAL